MWLLIVGMCIQVSPVDVECHVEPVSILTDRRECAALIRPMQAMWRAEADAAGLLLVFLGVGCKGGKVS